jgi:NADH:ubiquinone oxidoreductase subunit F (NADH-binding)
MGRHSVPLAEHTQPLRTIPEQRRTDRSSAHPPTLSPPSTVPPAAPPAVPPPAAPPPPWEPAFVGPSATPWSTLPQPAVRTPPLPRRLGRQPVPQPAAERAAAPTPARLLAGWLATGQPADLREHLRRHGPMPRDRFAGRKGAADLLALVAEAGLRGRGGAGFPTARKMSAVLASASSRRRPVVVANGCEGDPTSTKDQLLLHSAPHLVLDGLALAAHAVGADQAIVCVPRGSTLVEPLEDAVARRTEDPARVHIVTTPHRFVASEASALVNFLTTGDARPTSSPPLPAERGAQGRPTLVDNVETLAHLALLARHDAAWFRARGTADSPGTMLFTVGGAVGRPGVYEVDLGAPVGELLALAGGTTGPAQAALLGGLGGTWLPLPSAINLALAHRKADQAGPALGLASLLVLPPDACGLAVTSAILTYLAGESAGQCGPCMFGLPAVAADVEALADGSAEPELLERLRRRLGVIPGRGACAHPDGAVGLAASALAVFAADLAEHAAGRPCGRAHVATLPILDHLSDPEQGWR